VAWFFKLNAPSDVSKDTPSTGDVLVYNTTTLMWELKPRSEFGASDAVYLGDPLTNGTWRIVRDGNDLSYQRLEASVWVEKGANIP
jgi:hypothetical protein